MQSPEAALAYQARGWAPIPLLHRDKIPRVTWQRFQDNPPPEETVRKWWAQRPDDNIAVVMGRASRNLMALDVDPRNGGNNSIRGMPLPPTFVTETGGGGWHYLYRMPETLPKKTGALPGIDLLGHGSYAVMPPSIHPNGKEYTLAIDEPVASAPPWVLELMDFPIPETSPQKTRNEIITTGERNEILFKAACGFLRGCCSYCGGRVCNVGPGHLFRRLQAMNKKRCVPALPEAEIHGIAQNAWNIVNKKIRQEGFNDRKQQANTNGLLLTIKCLISI